VRIAAFVAIRKVAEGTDESIMDQVLKVGLIYFSFLLNPFVG
jgi:hypothetical protein